MGRALLQDAETFVQGTHPRALIILPTRELAAQVQRELGWLFATTRARLVSCTGGTDLRLDARALKRGAEIVVGTPGRLVDLIERKCLQLSSLEMVVLDEADEMLDMGFREALEILLEASPKARRTLLFSATLPKTIQAMARRYQKDALSIDPRSGAPTAHADIQHTAHLYARGDRLATLVNILRLADEERTLIFCRTREAVAELHQQLLQRGFLVTAISGDRAQHERNHALEALRSGRVRLLVATNVAARGIDLPDLGVVLHADLPENGESLTHRSGRTGRAGKKGQSIFIVEEGAQRKAERLFASAHLRLHWTAAPNAESVAAHHRKRLEAELSATPMLHQEVSAFAAELLLRQDATTLLTALLARALQAQPKGEVLKPISPPAIKRAKSPLPVGGAMRAFEVNLGLKDQAVANWILPLICRRGGITRREVGAIRVARDRTYFEVAAEVAARFAETAHARDPRAPHVRIGPATAPMPTRSFAHTKLPRSAPPHRASRAAIS